MASRISRAAGSRYASSQHGADCAETDRGATDTIHDRAGEQDGPSKRQMTTSVGKAYLMLFCGYV